MVFADYLCRNPSGKPTPENEDDEKFVINTMQEIKHAWLKHIIEPTGILKPSGKSIQSKDQSSPQNEQNDVIDNKQNTLTKEHAFCHNSLKNKSLRATQTFTPNGNSQLIAI